MSQNGNSLYSENVWNLLDYGMNADQNLSLYTVVGSARMKGNWERCCEECTQCSTHHTTIHFLVKSKHRRSLRVGILNHSENLQVRSAQCPLQQNSKSRYHSFNCAVGTQWPLSVCLKCKYGKHIHIQWYLINGSNIGLWFFHCFRERKISLLSGHYWVNFKSTNLSIAQVAWASQA